MTKIYINGKFFDKQDAKVSVYDHGFLYGDGVFEGIRIYNSKAFRLKQHIDRLYESARSIYLEIPIPREQMTQAVNDTIKVNERKDGYIRLVVSRGAGSLGLDPRKTTDPQVIVIADDIVMYPKEMYEHGMDLVTAATIRAHPNSLNPNIKSMNYLNNIMAKVEGIQAGCVEALMLNFKGEIAECTGDNIFLVKGGALKTPPAEAGILVGITRDAIIELARADSIAVHEIALTRHDLYTADECFLTGTAAEVIPVVKCDGRAIGTGKPGPITRKLLEKFRQLTRA
jgi:branched-chain amino acid aminotransferase